MTTTNSEQPSQRKKLVLKKETLRQLTTTELQAVAGGVPYTRVCTAAGNSGACCG